MPAVIMVDGQRQGWGDIQLVGYGRIFTGFTEIDIKSDQDKSNEYGQGRSPIFRGRGNKKAEGHSITMYHYEVFNLIKAIKAAGGNDLTDAAPVTINIVFIPGGNDTLSRIDVPYFEFTSSGLGVSSKQGDKSIPMKLSGISGIPVLI